MALFFFDTTSPRVHHFDDEGCECADIEAAVDLARKALCEIARDDQYRAAVASYTVQVRAADGAPAYEATLTLTGTRI